MLARAITATLTLGIAACGSRPPDHEPNAERFSTRGRITLVKSDALHIFHERIPQMRGVTGKLEPMEAMTMVFTATDAAPIRGFAAGDAVRFDFTVDYKKPPPLRIVAIEKLPAGTALDLPAAPVE